MSVLDSIDPVPPVYGESAVTLVEALVITEGTGRVHVAIYEGKQSRLKCGAASEFHQMSGTDHGRYFQGDFLRCGNCIPA